MPTGKVKWYDAEKGFGFLSREDGDDVYVRSSSLPEGVTTLKAGTRVEFGILSGPQGRAGPPGEGARRPALGLPEPARAQRKKPEDMVGIVEDLIRLLEGVEQGYRAGRHPDPKTAKPTAKLLRGLADELRALSPTLRHGSGTTVAARDRSAITWCARWCRRGRLRSAVAGAPDLLDPESRRVDGSDRWIATS